MSHKVDLDALDNAAALLRNYGLYENAKKVETAIAELSELRELVGCAVVYQVGSCRVFALHDGKWQMRSSLHDTLPEALAAARKWEVENA